MAKVKQITVESGVSFEKNGVWYKFRYSMDVEIEEEDNLADIKKKSWNTAHNEISKQVEDLVDELN